MNEKEKGERMEEFEKKMHLEVPTLTALEEIPIYQFVEKKQSLLSSPLLFNLKITGPLTPVEKETFLEFISKEDFGIREVDLEVQLQSERIFIPQISEYAAIILLQALRDTHAQIELCVSDSGEALASASVSSFLVDAFTSIHEGHPAEKIPILIQTQLPSDGSWIDEVHASTVLSTRAFEAKDSSKYQQTLESLQRSLKYKAYQKGGNLILAYQVQCIRLFTPMAYRITVMGTAVRCQK